MYLAVLYQVDGLSKACTRYLTTEINVQNVIPVYSSLISNNLLSAQDMEKNLWDFVCKNGNACITSSAFSETCHPLLLQRIVQATCLEVKEETLWSACVEWATKRATKAGRKREDDMGLSNSVEELEHQSTAHASETKEGTESHSDNSTAHDYLVPLIPYFRYRSMELGFFLEKVAPFVDKSLVARMLSFIGGRLKHGLLAPRNFKREEARVQSSADFWTVLASDPFHFEVEPGNGAGGRPGRGAGDEVPSFWVKDASTYRDKAIALHTAQSVDWEDSYSHNQWQVSLQRTKETPSPVQWLEVCFSHPSSITSITFTSHRKYLPKDIELVAMRRDLEVKVYYMEELPKPVKKERPQGKRKDVWAQTVEIKLPDGVVVWENRYYLKFRKFFCENDYDRNTYIHIDALDVQFEVPKESSFPALLKSTYSNSLPSSSSSSSCSSSGSSSCTSSSSSSSSLQIMSS